MIVHPKDWEKTGQPIQIEEIDERLKDVLSDIDCNSLAFSGGIDSSILLYHLSHLHPKVYAFTIGRSEDHPDVKYARSIAGLFPNVVLRVYVPKAEDIEKEKREGDLPGDEAVRLFYKWVSKYTDKIVTGDGVDEYTGGYYPHQNDPTEETYYDFIRRLRDEQLRPLHKNSGKVKVYLPYIDSRILLLLSQIPLSEKVDSSQRKKVMVELAKDKIPEDAIYRRKRGFVSALEDIKEPSDNAESRQGAVKKKTKKHSKSVKVRKGSRVLPSMKSIH